MNDFRQINGITVEKVRACDRKHVEFMEMAIQPGRIAITHFAPSWWSIALAYIISEVNDYYATDLEDLIL